MNVPLELECRIVTDPDGHQGALLLKGDWLFVLISDGAQTGIGEASHSGSDAHCVCTIYDLFERFLQSFDLSLEGIRRLETEAFSSPDSFLTATAISGINQALYDLLARREGVPVWRLFTQNKQAESVQLYTTINRALGNRSDEDYLMTIANGLRLGYTQFKCAPFEKVLPGQNQVNAASEGLHRLNLLRTHYPGLDLRVDFHCRFSLDSFLEILPELEALHLHWIEEPCTLGDCYASIRQAAKTPLAGGELFFGVEKFQELAEGGLVDIVMPDVKHVGGFRPLLDVCSKMEAYRVQVSPHNPSGPISTLASAHAAAVTGVVTSLELPLRTYGLEPALMRWQEKDHLYIPDEPGWGINLGDLIS